MRQLQTKKSDYIAYAEWNGDGPTGPIPPDNTYLFVDVTDVPEAKLGGTYNPVDNTWSAPPAPVTVLRIKKTDFINILTPTEYVAMLGPQTDSTMSWGVGLYDAASDPFLTEDPRVKQMLDYSASIGDITQVRADEIYAAMIAVSVSFSPSA
jgi:hypothetical protein